MGKYHQYKWRHYFNTCNFYRRQCVGGPLLVYTIAVKRSFHQLTYTNCIKSYSEQIFINVLRSTKMWWWKVILGAVSGPGIVSMSIFISGFIHTGFINPPQWWVQWGAGDSCVAWIMSFFHLLLAEYERPPCLLCYRHPLFALGIKIARFTAWAGRRRGMF